MAESTELGRLEAGAARLEVRGWRQVLVSCQSPVVRGGKDGAWSIGQSVQFLADS